MLKRVKRHTPGQVRVVILDNAHPLKKALAADVMELP